MNALCATAVNYSLVTLMMCVLLAAMEPRLSFR